MSSGTYVSYSGAATGMAALEVIANNVANASVAGYRRDQIQFDSVLGAHLPFAGTAATTVDLTPAALRPTGNPLHAAVQGNGFFVVEGPDGEELLTRRGDFRLDAAGRLVLPNGLPALGTSGPLSVPPDSEARLEADGTLVTAAGPVGRLRVVEVEDPSGLAKQGGSLLRATGASLPADVENARVAVGFVEESNVNLAAEMVALIRAARSFEASVQSMRITDQITERLIQAQS